MTDDDVWFEPKTYGYGAGMPVAWQGWALIGSYLAVVFGASLWLMPGELAAFVTLVLILTAVLLIVAARKTRGGWRWRWGEED